jgi:hypothetical protein
MEHKQRKFLAELCEAYTFDGTFPEGSLRLEEGAIALFPLAARVEDGKDVLVVGVRPNGNTPTIDADKRWDRIVLLRWATPEEKKQEGIMVGIPAECLELLIFDSQKNFFFRSGIRSECYLPTT